MIFECAKAGLDLILDLFYYENVNQVHWLQKLDLMKALTECDERLTSTKTFVKLLCNMTMF